MTGTITAAPTAIPMIAGVLKNGSSVGDERAELPLSKGVGLMERRDPFIRLERERAGAKVAATRVANLDGKFVGAGEGSKVVSPVGLKDSGILEGAEAGCSIGSPVGVCEGADEGSFVGSFVGIALGTTEGSIEGAALGSTVGLFEGSELGSSVGAMLGIRVGSKDGMPVGI